MAFKPITTPKGSIIQGTNGKAELRWSSDFAPRVNQNFTRIQKFVDSEVLRRCSPRVPFQTGALEKSGKLGTVVGSGVVQYIAPYARMQYFNTSESRAYDPNRGAKWFERMKVAEKRDILEGARKLGG
jgi:hypothetical protein